MKIAIDVSQALYATGVSAYTRHLVDHLTHLKTKHRFVLFGGSLRRKRELDLWINRLPRSLNKTNFLSPTLAHFLWNTLHLLPVESFTGPVDLIHTSDWAEPPAHAPKVTTIHDLSFFINPHYVADSVRRVHKKRLFWVAKESAHIIAVSQSTKNDIVKFLSLDPAKITVIYEGPNLPRLTSLPPKTLLDSLSITPPYLLVPGCGHPRKNIPRLVKAFTKLALKDLKLVIIGHPTLQEAKLRSERIIFTGPVSSTKLAAVYAWAEAVVYPSLYEGFGLPLLDAFSSGVPVVTSNVSSLPEIAGQAAILVDPTSFESIADGIPKALKNRDLLIPKGYAQLKKFSWRQTAQQTLKLYQQVVKNSH